ncbi:transcription factor HES-7 [Oryzias latipes]|uniref:Her1-11 n=1 Tax=Oryzias latipes TaxID=8090 RepID=Q2TP34_ORYLA|nr:transcription factor HES-7 [Oryzias latipes]AAW23098.1 Her1-11 [Oryzias latipes]
MTRRQQTTEDSKSGKRILKPVVEKKRRDRINQSLAELRSLLLNVTSDPRLHNPKLEKAEILDLAVEYLKKWTDRKNARDAESSAPPLLSTETAGFQHQVSQLTSFMHKVTPAQRTRLMETLRHHAESLQPRPDPHEGPDAAPAETLCKCDHREESPWLLFPPNSSFQPPSCSTPCHDYLSPPSSPWFPHSFPTYAASPPFPSFACCFPSPPNLSPPSSNTSYFSFSPTFPHTSPLGLHVPLLTSLRHPPNLPHREESTPECSNMWRPWF